MEKQWFAISELRAAKLPDFDDKFLRSLAGMFDRCPPICARTRVIGDDIYTAIYEAEFHVSVFPQAMREQLRHVSHAAAIDQRVRKLGIHRAVYNPRSVYVGPDVDAEIDAVERALNGLKARRAA
jgi:hypothetical protein